MGVDIHAARGQGWVPGSDLEPATVGCEAKLRMEVGHHNRQRPAIARVPMV